MTTPSVARAGALSLALAGTLFALYPALRPYADESTLEGAAAMASTAWVTSHVTAIVAFGLLTLGLVALSRSGAAARRPATVAAGLAWLGTWLVLPYYGAETFGLQVIGARAVADGDVSLLELAEAFRYGPVAMTTFGAGLLLLAGAGVTVAVALRGRGGTARAAGLLLGAGLALYLPQFFATPGLRIAHGILVLAGCVLTALVLMGAGRTSPAGQRTKAGSSSASTVS